MQITAHCAGYSGGFARVIAAGAFPGSVDEFLAPILADIAAIQTATDAQRMLKANTEATLQAMDMVREEQIGSLIITPQGKTPFRFFLTIPAVHLTGHAYQIDYLQTCWNDQTIHLN